MRDLHHWQVKWRAGRWDDASNGKRYDKHACGSQAGSDLFHDRNLADEWAAVIQPLSFAVTQS
ncbi:hypothetical protein AB4144_50280, partial [Rhizobiaceae sp. 2RAB30]